MSISARLTSSVSFIPFNVPFEVFDLFSGLGGFSLGLEATGGFKTVGFCEAAVFPRRVLAKQFPDVPVFDDVRTLTKDRLDEQGIEVDVICGGFPCTDISVAGNQEGLAGKHSGLWFEFARLIGELRPKYVFIENVGAIRSNGLKRVLKDLAKLGYDAEWHTIPAAAVGAPHRRDRLWVIAYPRPQGARRQPVQMVTAATIESVRARVATQLWGGEEPAHVVSKAKFSNRRVAACGNAVVPAVVQVLGEAVLAREAMLALDAAA